MRVELLFSMVKKFHEEIPNFLCILIETIGKFQTKSDLHEEVWGEGDFLEKPQCCKM